MTPAGPGPGHDDPDHVVLVGSMGVGKTTVGRIVAASLGWPLRDSDLDLDLQASGQSGRDLVRTAGVDALHRWEADHLLSALAAPSRATVIAAAASVVEDDRCLGALQTVFVAWLWAPVDVVLARMRAGDHRRGLGEDPRAALAALAARREPLYRMIADLRVDVGQHSAEEAAAVIVAGRRARDAKTAGG